jgi:glycosyltransferase involved in cell wall biosynthesis
VGRLTLSGLGCLSAPTTAQGNNGGDRHTYGYDDSYGARCIHQKQERAWQDGCDGGQDAKTEVAGHAFKAIGRQRMVLRLDELKVLNKYLRLLHVVPTYLPAVRYGGPIRSVHALCRELAALGHGVQVFTTNVDGPGESAVPLQRPVDVEGVKVTYFPSKLLRRLYWSPPMRRALQAGAADFDLIHLHSMFLWPTWIGARAARASGRPYLVSPRGMLIPQLIRHKNRWVKSAWIAMIDRRTIEGAAAIHATSAVEAAHLASFGWALPKVSIIPHGVDDPTATVGQEPSADVAEAVAEQPMVLALGRISWEKGLDRLIAALPLAPAARVVIAGDDADGHAAFLASEARRLGVAGRIAILPRHVDGIDKETLFAAARLFAMTSLSENFGLAAFEAMRRGVPVLATPDVGMAEVVREAGAGVVTEPSPRGIAAGMNSLLADALASQAMGEAGRRHVVAHYGWPSVAGRMEELYRSLTSAENADA